MDGRTLWLPLDARWISWEGPVTLGREFGGEAIAVLIALKSEAKLQNAGWKVKDGFTALAYRAFVVDTDKVRTIVERAAEIGVLDDLEVEDSKFVCRISGMAAAEERARASARKRAERQTGQTGTDRDTPGQTVTDPDALSRERERRGVKDSSLRSESVEQRLDDECVSPAGEHRKQQQTQATEPEDQAAGSGQPAENGVQAARRQARELFDYWRDRCGHERARPTRERINKVVTRLREGYSPEQIRTAIDGAARAAYVDDNGKRHDELELICRSGSKLELFIDRAAAAANGRHLSNDEWEAALNRSNVTVRS